jgi:hypothetical protein
LIVKKAKQILVWSLGQFGGLSLFYGMVILLMVCNMVVYSVVVLLVVGELPAAITGSHMGSRIDFRTIFGKIFSYHFLHGTKRKSITDS